MSGASALLVCKDVSESIRFYEENFGFRTTVRFPPTGAGVVEFANLVLGENIVMFISHAAMLEDCKRKGDRESPKIISKNAWGVGVNLYFSVADVDDMYQRVKSQGVRVVYDIEDKPYGTKEFTAADNNGYLLTFAQMKEFIKCGSCGMPMTKKGDFGGGDTENKFCVYCTDDKGNLKSRQEIKDGMVHGLMKMKNLSLQDAVYEVDESMNKMPVWKG